MQPHDTTSNNVSLKYCPNCDRWLPANSDNFHQGSGKHGFRHPCKQCRSQRPGGWIAPAQVGNLRCHTCLNEFPATTEFFALAKTEKRGFQTKCKTCSKEWRAENREKLRQEYRQRYDANPSKWSEYSKRYIQKTPGKRASDARKRYWASIEKARAYTRKRYALKREERIKSARKYAIANPEKVRTYNNRRAARRKSLPATITTAQWQECLAYWRGCCAYCGNQQGLLKNTILTMDHFIPLVSLDCPGTTLTNIIPACYSCNSSKNDKDPAKWLVSKFGKRRAASILARIEAYFASLV